MRLVIDMQGAQTESRFRGIGRYTMALAQEMARQRGEHEMVLVLNDEFSETIEPIRAEFADLLSFDAIHVFQISGSVVGHDSANSAKSNFAEIMYEALLASLAPDVVLISSLVEHTVTSVGKTSTHAPTALIMYDLIPLIHRNIYLQDANGERWYFNKLDHLRRADRLLSISASSGREAVEYLNFPESAVINISTACDAHFRPINITDAQRKYLQKTYGIFRDYIMYAGDIDWRKDIAGLFKAFSSLPKATHAIYSLVLVGRSIAKFKTHFVDLAKKHGLREEELVFTGYVSDEDLALLYNLCTLFVFPSWHEGFGLPVLEAMSCGKAVIAANSSSLPEVVGREDALFAPRDDAAMANKLAEVLTKTAFREELERHGLEQARKFSWETTAHRAWAALEDLYREKQQENRLFLLPARRPRMAYVSPLPPEQSGIANYSIELFPELSRRYDITVIVNQSQVSDAWIEANASIRDVAWFRKHAQSFDRVLYHFGDSPVHSHMFDLLTEIPGVVVMHDFFLSGVISHLNIKDEPQSYWTRALLAAHGWSAVCKQFQAQEDSADLIAAYPCNLTVLQQALGVIVHSDFSRQLARLYYGEDAAKDWSLIPSMRQPVHHLDKTSARQTLGLAQTDFVVCSFGFLDSSKLNHRLLDAWLASPLAQDKCCQLVFVGGNDSGVYGEGLLHSISTSRLSARVTITGWVDMETYRAWLAAADIGVQLRTRSRGETSDTILDCMNYGLPTLVNEHSSMAELPQDVLWMLPGAFTNAQLVEALITLYQNSKHREELGKRARDYIFSHHNPRDCADQYIEEIEAYYTKAQRGLHGLTQALPQLTPSLTVAELPRLVSELAANFPPRPRHRQIFLDISELVHTDLRTGIQRVTRSLLLEITMNPPEGWAVEPVYAKIDQPGYRYARQFMCRFLGIPNNWAEDAPVEAVRGDIFLGLDLVHPVLMDENILQAWRRRGVSVYFVIFDLLPVLMPEVFPEDARQIHQQWLSTVTRFDGALAISRAVADETNIWLQTFGQSRERAFSLNWFHLGADVDSGSHTRSLADDACSILNNFQARTTFLMVGTIEPRKGYLQTIAAFDQLWAQGVEVNLVIVGNVGWKTHPEEMRRDIPFILHTLQNHHERNNHLFWLEDISDEYLEKIYITSTCLIAASYGEGFGLPLIEAAHHGLPLLVRDIPVFREVTANHAHFFPDSRRPEAIADAVLTWLDTYQRGEHPQSIDIPHQTWKDSARQVLDAILGITTSYKAWLPDSVRRYWGSDPRLYTEVGKRTGREIYATGKAGMLIYGPYERFDPGRYRLLVRGTAEHWSGEEWLDVACDHGERKLLHQNLPTRESGPWELEVTLELQTTCTDLEIQLRVAELSGLSVECIEMATTTADGVQPERGLCVAD